MGFNGTLVPFFLNLNHAPSWTVNLLFAVLGMSLRLFVRSFVRFLACSFADLWYGRVVGSLAR